MGVPVTGTITPPDPADVCPTIDPLTGVDGGRSVADHPARDAIVSGTPLRCRQGMAVYTQSDGFLWTLKAGPWAGTDADWVQFVGAAGPTGPAGPTGATGATGAAGPAPSPPPH